MTRLIIFRHGERFLNTGEFSGDGPLTYSGAFDVLRTSGILTARLKSCGISSIDLAIVSGSLRGAQTFALLWRELINSHVTVKKYEMDKKYFSTEAEDILWKKMYDAHGKKLRKEIQALGEKQAVMNRAADMILPCVDRIARRIQKALNQHFKTILAVTHGPHDALLEERFTGKSRPDCLPLGECRIVEIPAKRL